MFSYSSNCVMAELPRITFLSLVACLVMAQGIKCMGLGSNLIEERYLYEIWTKCLPGHFGQNQISWTFFCEPKVSLNVLDRINYPLVGELHININRLD